MRVLSLDLPSQILTAVMHDYIMGQCDRHGGNIFVTEGSTMTFIDNEHAFWDMDRGAVQDCMP